MTTGPEIETPEPAPVEPLPSVDTSIIAAFGDKPLDIARLSLRRPTLSGRDVRTAVLWEVRTKLVVDGRVETWLYRREPAARAHAARLRAQGWPVKVARAAVTGWSVVSR